MRRVHLETRYYRQFDAEDGRDIPEEAMGGWQRTILPLDLDHTAIVAMHVWETGGRAAYPGWYRASPYLYEADRLVRDALPSVYAAARSARVPIVHVVPLHGRFRDLVEDGVERPAAPVRDRADATWRELTAIHAEIAHPGVGNAEDISHGFGRMGFPGHLEPAPGEHVVGSSEGLGRVLAALGVSHLLYVGFTLNGCITWSPGGMVDMARRGYLCSTVEGAVAALESAETARERRALKTALWEVAVVAGFVYGLEDLVAALEHAGGD